MFLIVLGEKSNLKLPLLIAAFPSTSSGFFPFKFPLTLNEVDSFPEVNSLLKKTASFLASASSKSAVLTLIFKCGFIKPEIVPFPIILFPS